MTTEIKIKKPLYKQFAGSIAARQNCIKCHNTEWQSKHEDTIVKLIDCLPHGSGINGNWYIDYEKSHSEKIVLSNTFDAMDENGFYDQYIDFTLTIKPSMLHDIDLFITGYFGKYQDIKEYLYETFNYALTENVEVN
jgi:hypothetical protein